MDVVSNRIRRATVAVLAVGLLLGQLLAASGAAAHPEHVLGKALAEEPSGPTVLVNSPDDLTGFLSAVQWSGTAELDDQQDDLVYAGTGCTPAHYANVDVAGRIAIVDQSQGQLEADQCVATYKQKMDAAELAGAIGLVQVDSDDDVSTGNAVSSGIPGLAVKNTDGAPLRDAVVSGTTVNVTLTDPSKIDLSQPLGYTACEDGQADVFPCDGIDLLSFTPLAEFQGEVDGRAALGASASDLWGWTDSETGDEYVIIGKTNGVGFFRITDPTDPEYLGELPSRAAAQLTWFDIKVYEDHAFIVSESNYHGMVVFDLTRLRDANGPQEWSEDAFYPLPAAAHNLEINTETGYAYIVGGNAGLAVPDQCLSGLHMVDISSPKTPVFAGCYLEEGGPGTTARLAADLTGESAIADNSPAAYVHDAQCVVYDGPDDDYDGQEICFNSAENKVVIADVTDKLNPVTLGWTDYELASYTHQAWLSEDQRYLFLNDEADETDHGIPTRTVVLDVTDLENPEPHFEHSHDTRSITHNNYVHDGLLYQSNYTSGLRVLDPSAVAEGTLTEIAYFDTFPAHGEPTFQGSWSNYPFFESGTIAVSGIDEGLFLLQLAEEDPEPQLGVEVACTDCPIEIRAGETGTANVTVSNVGDVDDTYGITLDGLPEGWTASAEPAEISVPASEDRAVTVTVDVPYRAQKGTYTFTVTATSTTDPTVGATDEIAVEVVKGRPSDAGPGDQEPEARGDSVTAADEDVRMRQASSTSPLPARATWVIALALGMLLLAGVTAGRRALVRSRADDRTG